MSATIVTSTNKILIIGPVYNKTKAISEAVKYFDSYDRTIFNGNLCYPFDEMVGQRIEIMDKYLQNEKIIYNLGNYDLQFLRKIEESGESPAICKWLKKQSNVIIVQMENQNVIVTCGGITPKMNKQELSDNLETTFVSTIDGLPWHRSYGGAFGYVISNNPLTNEKPQFYNFSTQMGNIYGENLKVYAQEVNQRGLGKTILLLDTNKNISL